MPPSPYLAERIDQSWCPSCKEWTVLDAGWPCAWCDTILVKRKGGWKRPDIHGRISESAARAIHAKYETGTSARTLGRELYRVLGYKSAHGCETAIGAAFHRYGLPVRDRIAATVLASTTKGLSPRDWHERRRRRLEAGLTLKGQERQAVCEGVKLQSPGKGKRCSRPAVYGSRFCYVHDPERRAEVIAITARMRAAA